MDHLLTGRRTLELDEHGRIQTSKPLDIVQRARLDRFAQAKLVGWRITGDSIRQAIAGGRKAGHGPPLAAWPIWPSRCRR